MHLHLSSILNKQQPLKQTPMQSLARNKWGTGAAIALAFALLMCYSVARANPLDLGSSNNTATSTVAYMTGGTATTTYTYDTYAGSSDQNAADKIAMLVQFTASSTASKLNWTYEFSAGGAGLDCVASPTSCDWYADTFALGVNATNTQLFNFTANNSGAWNFASSSQGGASVSASSNRGLKVLWVPTPTRYTRVVFSVPAGATNGGVWATFANQKQQP